MANLTRQKNPSIWVGLLKDFPEGFQGNEHQRIKSGELSRLLVSHYGKRLAFNLLSLGQKLIIILLILNTVSCSITTYQ